MHSNIQESDRKQDFVLLKCARIQFLPHGHDDVTVDVADVADDGFGVFKRHQLQSMGSLWLFWVRHGLDHFEEVDLPISQRG